MKIAPKFLLASVSFLFFPNVLVAQAPPINLEKPRKQEPIPRRPEPLTAPPVTSSSSNEISVSAGPVSSSLVGQDSDVGRQWITPVISSGETNSSSIKHQMRLINPDTSTTTRVRVSCYDMTGDAANVSDDFNLAPLNAKYYVVVHSFNKEEGIGEGWCQVISSLPIVVEGSEITIRQASNCGIGCVVPGKIDNTRIQYYVSSK